MEGRTILVKTRLMWHAYATSRVISLLRVATVFLALVVSSCSSSKTDSETTDGESIERPEAMREPIPAGHCRIVATVVEVHAPDADLGSENPCSRFPCAATVLVDSILGYGSGFTGTLAPGKHVEVRFTYTLAPSKQAHPSAAFSLPGLGSGDHFQADLSGSQEMISPGLDGRKGRYGVSLYRIVK